MKDIHFRKASESDMKDIMELQIKTFHGEQEIPVESIKAVGSTANWWCASDGRHIVGTIAAWMEHGEIHMGRFIVEPSFRGEHLGTRLAKYAVGEVFKENTDTIHLEARDATVAIFCHMGGQITGQSIPFYKGNVTPMILRKSDYCP